VHRQSASADKGLTPRDIKHGRIDTALGAGLGAAFGCGALIVGAALFTHNGSTIQGLAGAGFPGALELVSGKAVATLFALGLVEAGAVAVLTISASTAYAAAECVGVAHSFNASPRQAVLFHGANVATALLAAGVILIPGAPLLAIALKANVLATVLLPVALIFMLMLANDRELMGEWTNRRSTNALGVIVIAFVAICGATYGIDSFLPGTRRPPGPAARPDAPLRTSSLRPSFYAPRGACCVDACSPGGSTISSSGSASSSCPDIACSAVKITFCCSAMRLSTMRVSS